METSDTYLKKYIYIYIHIYVLLISISSCLLDDQLQFLFPFFFSVLSSFQNKISKPDKIVGVEARKVARVQYRSLEALVRGKSINKHSIGV